MSQTQCQLCPPRDKCLTCRRIDKRHEQSGLMRCAVIGCNKRTWAKGLCGTHYSHNRIHGSPVTKRSLIRNSETFLQRVDRTESCWVWLGSIDSEGYGQFGKNNTTIKAHRAAYVFFKGEIPDHMELDHLCRNRRCVNPDHLEPVTHAENIRRANAVMTHCKRGHSKAEYNANGRCMECHRMRANNWLKQKRKTLTAEQTLRMDNLGISPPEQLSKPFRSVWLKGCMVGMASKNGDYHNPYVAIKHKDGRNTFAGSYQSIFNDGAKEGIRLAQRRKAKEGSRG